MNEDGFYELRSMTPAQFTAFSNPNGSRVRLIGGKLPPVTSGSGREFVWTGHRGSSGLPGYQFASLSVSKDSERCILIAAEDTHMFNIPPHYVGLWFEDRTGMNIVCFDPERLPGFRISDVAGKFDILTKPFVYTPYYAESEPLCILAIDTNQSEGTSSISVHPVLQALNEILLVGQSDEQERVMLYYSEPDYPLYTIYSVLPQEQQVVVYPQKWFTSRHLDDGRNQSPRILHVLRNPENGRMMGDGVRIGPFQLKENGCDIDHWLKFPDLPREWRVYGPEILGFEFRSQEVLNDL